MEAKEEAGGQPYSLATPHNGFGIFSDLGNPATCPAATVETLKVLGHGRAAEARLVEVRHQDGHSFQCVEKVFRPGMLTRLIYRVCYQAPFGYQSNEDAILASFYRRRIAWVLCKALVPEVEVARPLYVRWEDQAKAFVLASEYVVGRGIVPRPTDPRMVRRRLRKILAGLDPKGPESALEPCPPQEIDELLAVMRRLEQVFLDVGMTGTGWQVCAKAIVSTANLLRTPRGYASVDLESGIPAFLVSNYVLAGIRLGRLPMFDDLDADRLRNWFRDRQPSLKTKLTGGQFDQLASDIESLVHHTERWKDSEPAFFRWPRCNSSRFRSLYRERTIDDWSRREIIDDRVECGLRSTPTPLFKTLVYWLGWLPGPPGRMLQRLWGNEQYRSRAIRLVSDREYRNRVASEFWDKRTKQLQAGKRIPAPGSEQRSRFGILFHWGLSKFLPANVHRWMTDSEYRRYRLTRLGLLCVSPRFQREYGRWTVERRIEAWRNEQRLTKREESRLLDQLDHPSIDEYLRGFGMHLGLKLLLPLLLPLKATAATAAIAAGEPFYFLMILMMLPMLRTAVTVWRMFSAKRPFRDFRDAMVVGALPTVGSLAFPIQMHSSCPELSSFLLRDFASRIGRILPIYGGKDSRTEIACIHSANVVVEAVDIWLGLVGSRSTVEADNSTTHSREAAPATVAWNRWDREAIAQMQLVRQESVEGQSCTAPTASSKAA